MQMLVSDATGNGCTHAQLICVCDCVSVFVKETSMRKREEERKAKRLKRVELFIKIQKIFTEKKHHMMCCDSTIKQNIRKNDKFGE